MHSEVHPQSTACIIIVFYKLYCGLDWRQTCRYQAIILLETVIAKDFTIAYIQCKCIQCKLLCITCLDSWETRLCTILHSRLFVLPRYGWQCFWTQEVNPVWLRSLNLYGGILWHSYLGFYMRGLCPPLSKNMWEDYVLGVNGERGGAVISNTLVRHYFKTFLNRIIIQI